MSLHGSRDLPDDDTSDGGVLDDCPSRMLDLTGEQISAVAYLGFLNLKHLFLLLRRQHAFLSRVELCHSDHVLLEFLPGHGVALCLQGLVKTFDHRRTTRGLLLVLAGDVIQLRASVDTSLGLDHLHSLDYILADMLRARRL